jgi:hypothetical protein
VGGDDTACGTSAGLGFVRDEAGRVATPLAGGARSRVPSVAEAGRREAGPRAASGAPPGVGLWAGAVASACSAWSAFSVRSVRQNSAIAALR